MVSAMRPLTFTILGEPVSGKNSRRILRNRKTGKPFSAKSERAAAYKRLANCQALVAALGAPMPIFPTERLSITATLYYASERSDLDGELLCDALQGSIYANDRQLREKHFFHKIDKINPRAVVTVEQL